LNSVWHYIYRRLHPSAFALAVALASVLTGCVANDIPYPHTQASFTSFAVKGGTAAIDAADRIVTVTLDELTDPSKVTVDSVRFNQGSAPVGDFPKVLDLSDTLRVTLHLYYDFEWRIVAIQPVERYFTVKGQIGKTVIEPQNHLAFASVASAIPLDSVTVLSLKLGPRGSTSTSPSINPGDVVDFTDMKKITVTSFGKSETWTLYVAQAEGTVSMKSVNGFSRVAYVEAEGSAEAVNGVMYRKEGDLEWIRVADSCIVFDGGAFTARLSPLEPLTTYECYAYSGEDITELQKFTTQETAELPNGSMNDWSLDGKCWNPWAAGGSSFWDTGNTGAAMLGESNTYPTDDVCDSTSTKAACLASRFVGVAGIGKFAAGSVFAGRFGGIDGMNGIIYLGRPFTLRPTRLEGYYKYLPGRVDYAGTGFEGEMGKTDTLMVYVCLGDWTSPVEIRTNPANRKKLDVQNDPHIIAYGCWLSGDRRESYAKFSVPFEYRAYNRVPNYLIITCTGSRSGDDFTGSSSSVMYVDEMSLKWD
jgi:hypothetical protein